MREYRVLGNTVLETRHIEGVLYPRLGPNKHFSDIEAARGALEEAYHAAGYGTVFVDIPPQQVVDGIVRLHVTEAKLRVRSIGGARFFSEGQLLAELPASRPGTVPKLSDLQQQIGVVNAASADRSVVPVLKAGPEPGTMDLALRVDDHLPLHGSVELDNQATPDTKPLRATVALSYDNLFNELDSIAAQYTVAPQKWGQVGVFAANYAFHPIWNGVRPSLSFTNSSSDVAALGTLGVIGAGQIFSGRLVAPLQQAPGATQLLTMGLDYKHFHNTLDLAVTPTNNTPVVIEPTSYVNASLGYTGAWQQYASGSGAAPELRRFETISLVANVGPRGLANNSTDFANGRYQGGGNYAYLRLDSAFTANLPLDLQLGLRFGAQVALEPLLAYEQMNVTGVAGVRGYLEAEDLGDSAYMASMQLRSPIFHRAAYKLLDVFGFFDAGQSHYIDALPGEPSHTELRSVGFGMDVLPGHAVTGQLIWADPLVNGPRTRAHESRLLFDLKGSF